MAAPNMATITESIERSLQNCSLDHHHHHSSSSSSSSNSTSAAGGIGGSRSGAGRSDSPENHDVSDNPLELNSEVPLPYYWEQCLDLKTGEIYFINWRTGMKSHEDPRTNPDHDLSSEDDAASSSYDDDSEESSSEQSSSIHNNNRNGSHSRAKSQQQVLVVTGCKSCFMYFMVPKQVGDCPKCCGQLLHFDRSD